MADEEAVRRHRELAEEGWVRRFSADEPRLSEMKASYEALGYEVHLEPGMIGDRTQCAVCFDTEGFSERYKTIYTKKRPSSDISDDDLFD